MAHPISRRWTCTIDQLYLLYTHSKRQWDGALKSRLFQDKNHGFCVHSGTLIAILPHSRVDGPFSAIDRHSDHV